MFCAPCDKNLKYTGETFHALLNGIFLLLCTTQGSFHWNVIMVTELHQLICEYDTGCSHSVFALYGWCIFAEFALGCDEKGWVIKKEK